MLEGQVPPAQLPPKGGGEGQSQHRPERPEPVLEQGGLLPLPDEAAQLRELRGVPRGHGVDLPAVGVEQRRRRGQQQQEREGGSPPPEQVARGKDPEEHKTEDEARVQVRPQGEYGDRRGGFPRGEPRGRGEPPPFQLQEEGEEQDEGKILRAQIVGKRSSERPQQQPQAAVEEGGAGLPEQPPQQGRRPGEQEDLEGPQRGQPSRLMDGVPQQLGEPLEIAPGPAGHGGGEPVRPGERAVLRHPAGGAQMPEDVGVPDGQAEEGGGAGQAGIGEAAPALRPGPHKEGLKPWGGWLCRL